MGLSCSTKGTFGNIRILIGKAYGTSTLGRHRSKLDDNIKVVPKEIKREDWALFNLFRKSNYYEFQNEISG
jgi:hypothetical protein